MERNELQAKLRNLPENTNDVTFGEPSGHLLMTSQEEAVFVMESQTSSILQVATNRQQYFVHLRELFLLTSLTIEDEPVVMVVSNI